MTTDQERQYICSRAEALCLRATVLCTRVRAQLTSLNAHRAQLTVHRYRLQELMYQQRSIRGACSPRRGRKRHVEIVVLTNLVARLRRPFGL